MAGSTLNYSRHASGIFLYPFDSDFGVARVFVDAGRPAQPVAASTHNF